MAVQSYPLTTLIIPGSQALSDSRLDRLLKSSGAIKAAALWVHYVAPSRPLDSDNAALTQILTYGDPPLDNECTHKLRQNIQGDDKNLDSYSLTYFVTPRIGTVSPWSTLATAIAHVCGLQDSVHRIERGIAFRFEFNDLQSGSPSWTSLLFDRMTQQLTVNQPPNTSLLFAESSPSPARTVKVLGANGPSVDALEKANRDEGLALDKDEIKYLAEGYGKLGRDPTDVELFMFAQVFVIMLQERLGPAFFLPRRVRPVDTICLPLRP